jgi:hypothetical protein
MAELGFFSSILVLLSNVFLILCEHKAILALNRDDFPPGFIFGAGVSAYQVRFSSLTVINIRRRINDVTTMVIERLNNNNLRTTHLSYCVLH